MQPCPNWTRPPCRIGSQEVSVPQRRVGLAWIRLACPRHRPQVARRGSRLNLVAQHHRSVPRAACGVARSTARTGMRSSTPIPSCAGSTATVRSHKQHLRPRTGSRGMWRRVWCDRSHVTRLAVVGLGLCVGKGGSGAAASGFVVGRLGTLYFAGERRIRFQQAASERHAPVEAGRGRRLDACARDWRGLRLRPCVAAWQAAPAWQWGQQRLG